MDHEHEPPSIPDTLRVSRFRSERDELNEVVSRYAGLTMKRFFRLDGQAYESGALPQQTKELLGLVASLVLRCDDCILYHLIRCREEGTSGEEIQEAMTVGLVVGGSITIPHLRRAMRAWDEMEVGETPRTEPDHPEGNDTGA